MGDARVEVQRGVARSSRAHVANHGRAPAAARSSSHRRELPIHRAAPSQREHQHRSLPRWSPRGADQRTARGPRPRVDLRRADSREASSPARWSSPPRPDAPDSRARSRYLPLPRRRMEPWQDQKDEPVDCRASRATSLSNEVVFVENCRVDWRGKRLVLHVDHVNGINNDNRLPNLRFLCPNCHSQTPTFGNRRR